MSARSEAGYELYKALGSERTYGRVAELMGLSEKTVRQWGYKEKWQERLNNDFIDKSKEIQKKREELEHLGFDVAITALGKIKDKIEDSKLSKELGQIYELFLTTPYKAFGITESVEEQSACATSGADKIEIKFDITGGVSSED